MLETANNIDFKMGESYRNRLGQYEVLEIKGHRMRVRYEADGNVSTLTIEDQKRILSNILREEKIIEPEPVPWIDRARRITHRYTRQTIGNHYLYIILLSNVYGKDSGYALYVGETSKTPEERFEQHLKGYKASRFVKYYGTRLLPELYEHLIPLGREEAKNLEGEIAKDLKRHAILTFGGH